MLIVISLAYVTFKPRHTCSSSSEGHYRVTPCASQFVIHFLFINLYFAVVFDLMEAGSSRWQIWNLLARQGVQHLSHE